MNRIVVSDRYGLTPFNPTVQRVSKILGWQATTLINRTKNALPAPLEQNLFLQTAQECKQGVHPETFAQILRFFAPARSLQEADMKDRFFGSGLVHNRFVEVADQVFATLSVMEKLEDRSSRSSISAITAARLVFAYGEDGAEEVVSMVESGIDSLMEELGWKISPLRATAIILKEIAQVSAEGGGSAWNVRNEEDVVNLMKGSTKGWSQ